ncbi:MAG: hypothetical protein U5N58_06005 [Actinomycetota bacterium]|nr:hypothetical protein [Actinomycetota bacterium]
MSIWSEDETKKKIPLGIQPEGTPIESEPGRSSQNTNCGELGGC